MNLISAKTHIRTLPCLDIPSNNIFKIVETNASKIGFRGIPKQLVSSGSPEQIVRFHSGSWNSVQFNIIKKEIISVITKFQSDLLSTDYKSAKYILKKMLKILHSNKILPNGNQFLVLLILI
jgi:hypothetical protein